ncbi:hypothetical protein E4U42_007171 [Claviceps africana]|uniref:Uncharacterized protein n=1 Tax=Claviceps africana TaxID=83212 RepID=A0A8K0NFA2_9HYPO|nr:hypothetical protein E4U42_007171 [Claviceps africana]
MAPPPPLNATPTCPCAKCFNVLAQRPYSGHAHQPHGQYAQYSPVGFTRRDSDEITLVGKYGYDVATTTHVEMARSK